MVGLGFFPHYLNAIIFFITFQGFPSIFWHYSGICFCFVSGFYSLLKHNLLCNMDLPCCYMRRALEQSRALNVHFTSYIKGEKSGWANVTWIFKLMDEIIQFNCLDLAKNQYSVLISKPAFSLGGEFCAMTPAVHWLDDDSGNVFILLLFPPCGAFILMLLSNAVCPVLPHPPKIARGKRLCPASSAAAGLSRTDNPICGLAAVPC